jgi:beta-phosphoglucomutase-like phosphatase (HAD superfamily)
MSVASSVAVEDSGVGIRSALAAGLAVIAIPNPAYPPEPAVLRRADAVLGSIGELRATLCSGEEPGSPALP